MSSKDFKKIIVDKLSETLKPRHFKKSGNIFSFSNGDLTYFVGIQSSQNSTTETLKVTVNTEIASALISKLDDISIPIKHQRHYTRRIGAYLDDSPDKWWIINNTDLAKKSANEISELIITKVIPTFDSLKTTDDLANLWRNGGYIGITQGERKNFLNLLDNCR